MLEFCCPHGVPMVYPICTSTCSQNSSSLYPISFVLSSTLVAQKEEITTYLFWDCLKVDFYYFLINNKFYVGGVMGPI